MIKAVLETPAMQELRQRMEPGGVCSLAGVDPAAQPFLCACLRAAWPDRPLVAITHGVKVQESFHQDLETWFSLASLRTSPAFYPAWEVLPHESKLPHSDVISERLETLVALTNSSSPATVVTNVLALMQKTFSPGELRKQTRTFKKGDRIDPLDLVEWLESLGYEPEAQVSAKGEIALRGGILDVYPPPSPWPVRLEFFGDELESLRFFDPHTQISRDETTTITISPAGELVFLKNQLRSDPATPLATLLDYLPAQTLLVVCEPAVVLDRAEEYEAQIPAGDPFFISWKDWLAQAEARRGTLLNLFDTHDPGRFSGFEHNSPEALRSLRNAVDLLDERNPEIRVGSLFNSLEAFRPDLQKAAEAPVAEARREEFFQQIHRWLRQGYTVQIFCHNDGEKQRFQEIWAEHGLDKSEFPQPQVSLGSLARGFIYEPARLVIVTDAEIFGRYKVQRPRRLRSPHATAARSALDIDFGDLEPGDFVVHLQHGIGRFQGVELMPRGSGGKSKTTGGPEPGPECLVIEYAPNDVGQLPPKLYVPITEAHLVSKYVGTGKARPQLHKLGGTLWTKAKAQAEHAVRDLASELLSIQAARETMQGLSFGDDTPWQREFESAFVYQETPDQLKAINETKSDMQSHKPMDRLICGDVGYGKTEVAIRAAFKAVMSGKQVAILVPTTVLAQQHYNTFRERMADYPVRIEQLSRFRTKGQQRKTLEALASGSVDIVIGTHRLIQEDVVFKDLGLVIIDEEQRFGVLHKEKFKLLRRLVDVLTLSATPIPRTLYLALTGARDMSTIETPPQDRLPVETVVAQYDERLIRDAIQRELNRGGQAYFLHNRVFDIYETANKISALVPKARLVVGHGQMDADELEDVMAKFINGEADVLVSTTIIESGIDIPNANTIIIDRADRFGLSDLYQLRGRVGRYKHQAYAYLLLPRHAALLSDVRKRISAIKQYSSLGSGFKIAMRDLEIRGAGNLLGAQQSGHITAVGFDLYCQLLKQSVSTLKGEKVAPRIEVQTRFDFLATNPGEEAAPVIEQKNTAKSDLEILVPRETATYRDRIKTVPPEEKARPVARVPAYIPLDYIPDPQQRISIYRRLAQALDKSSIEALKAELRDRFGPLPPAVELLLLVSEIKIVAALKSVTAIETEGDKLKVMRRNDFVMFGAKFPRLTKREPKPKLNEIKKFLLAI